MSKRLPKSTWAEIRTARASGIGLRELARNMGIPAGTVLARSNREQWTRQIQSAKALVQTDGQSNAITVTQSVTMRERGERHVARMANVVEKVLPHVEGMEPGAILESVDEIEKLDKVARRTFGIVDDVPQSVINIAFIASACATRAQPVSIDESPEN